MTLKYKRGNPGNCNCSGGTPAHPACTCADVPIALFADLPGLGLTNIPVTFSGGFWSGCFNLSVLGYAICSTAPPTCSTATVTAGFRITFACDFVGGIHRWTLNIEYTCYGGDTCEGSPNANTPSRALDVACGGASCISGFAFVDAGWIISPLVCSSPVNVVFSGAPALTFTGTLGTPTNLYLGSGGVTIHQ